MCCAENEPSHKENDENDDADDGEDDEIELHVLPPPAEALALRGEKRQLIQNIFKKSRGREHFALQVRGILVKQHALLRQTLRAIHLQQKRHVLRAENAFQMGLSYGARAGPPAVRFSRPFLAAAPRFAP
jgi:hypothetical protein